MLKTVSKCIIWLAQSHLAFGRSPYSSLLAWAAGALLACPPGFPRMGPPREHEGRCSRLLLWKYAPSRLQCPPPAQLCAVEGAHRVWILGSQEHWVILETGTLTCFQVPSGFHMQNSHFCFPNEYLENTHVFHISPSSLTLISLKISPRYLTMTQSD